MAFLNSHGVNGAGAVASQFKKTPARSIHRIGLEFDKETTRDLVSWTRVHPKAGKAPLHLKGTEIILAQVRALGAAVLPRFFIGDASDRRTKSVTFVSGFAFFACKAACFWANFTCGLTDR